MSQSLQELYPAWVISKFHYSPQRNEGGTELCHLLGENTVVISRSRGLCTQESVIMEFLVVTWPRRAFKRDLKENNGGVYEFLQEAYSGMKGSMGEDREALAAPERQRYWRLLPWAGEAGVTS